MYSWDLIRVHVYRVNDLPASYPRERRRNSNLLDPRFARGSKRIWSKLREFLYRRITTRRQVAVSRKLVDNIYEKKTKTWRLAIAFGVREARRRKRGEFRSRCSADRLLYGRTRNRLIYV